MPEPCCGDGSESGNLIVQGDSLHALKSLLPRCTSQVECIYNDPPYNTGNEDWVYSDNVNSPEIRKWLGVEGQAQPILDVEYKGAARWSAAEDDWLIGGRWANLSDRR